MSVVYRTAVFMISVVCYGVFLLVFLYLLGFLGNLPVPRSIESRNSMSPGKARPPSYRTACHASLRMCAPAYQSVPR